MLQRQAPKSCRNRLNLWNQWQQWIVLLVLNQQFLEDPRTWSSVRNAFTAVLLCISRTLASLRRVNVFWAERQDNWRTSAEASQPRLVLRSQEPFELCRRKCTSVHVVPLMLSSLLTLQPVWSLMIVFPYLSVNEVRQATCDTGSWHRSSLHTDVSVNFQGVVATQNAVQEQDNTVYLLRRIFGSLGINWGPSQLQFPNFSWVPPCDCQIWTDSLDRNWLRYIPLDWQAINQVTPTQVQTVLKRHESVLQDGLGALKGYQAKIMVDSNATPPFCKSCSVPYAHRELAEKELNNLMQEGTLEPVEYAEWASQILPVLKKDKNSVRVYGDFKQTINPVSHLDWYSIPKVEDLFTSLAEGCVFSKIDLSQAYQQVPIEESAWQYVVINTHKWLFRYTKLPFGVSSAPAFSNAT